MSKQEKLDRHFLRLAWMTAYDLSKDPSTKVGAAIVSPDTRQVSLGYNGFPRGADESPEKWERPEKYPRVIHAELNALLNCPFDSRGCTVYVTLQPCHVCIGMLQNAGIKRIVYNVPYDRLERQDIWDEYSKLFDEVIQLSDPVCTMIKNLGKEPPKNLL